MGQERFFTPIRAARVDQLEYFKSTSLRHQGSAFKLGGTGGFVRLEMGMLKSTAMIMIESEYEKVC